MPAQTRPVGYGPAMPSGADEEVLAVMDDDGEEVALDAAEADALFGAELGGLEAGDRLGLPRLPEPRRSACVALVDLLDARAAARGCPPT